MVKWTNGLGDEQAGPTTAHATLGVTRVAASTRRGPAGSTHAPSARIGGGTWAAGSTQAATATAGIGEVA